MNLETDPVKLLIRWEGVGRPLCDIERELLTIHLFSENSKLGGDLHRQARDLIQKMQKDAKDYKWQSYRIQ